MLAPLLFASAAALQRGGGDLSAVFSVTSFGAKGDGRTDDTSAVRAAATAVAANGGGTLLFAGSGQFVTGPVNISSNTHVHIDTAATILGSTNASLFPLLTIAKFWPQFGQDRDAVAGTESARLMHQPMLFSWNTTNVSVTGGTIDCNGQMWRGCADNLTRAPCGGYSRPHCVFFANATSVRFEHTTVLRPGDWSTHFSSCTNIRISGVNVTSPHGANGDGIDIDSSQDVVIKDTFISSGDDAIAMKSGIDYWGRLYNRSTRDVIVRNVTIAAGYGLAIGSETSGGVINVTFEDITVLHETAGIHIKTQRGRGGVIDGITYRNIQLVNVRQCILIGVGTGGLPLTNASATPIVRNIVFENVHCSVGTTSSYDLSGLPESPVQNLSFINVTMGKDVKPQASCGNVECTCDQHTLPCPSCCKPRG
eukprot:COSAG02_NODE_456_length_21968_cov_13.528145_4_plen_423_part_00